MVTWRDTKLTILPAVCGGCNFDSVELKLGDKFFTSVEDVEIYIRTYFIELLIILNIFCLNTFRFSKIDTLI